jgi:hypothetical protein
MFPELPSFQADEEFLHALGRAGGLCDCRDIDDSPDSLGDTAAGWPIFGQFVAHDITADRSGLRSPTDTAELRNARSPQLNLECLYGDGPIGSPFLFRRDDPAKFLLGLNGADVQRNVEGIAVKRGRGTVALANSPTRSLYDKAGSAHRRLRASASLLDQTQAGSQSA